mmetsp:Transcript_58655/g.109781  ORF Transcript_58655/g.109781 Transcript_58655/m.109781 type:complete len:197 (+) Transcript_58655:104-694(+)
MWQLLEQFGQSALFLFAGCFDRSTHQGPSTRCNGCQPACLETPLRAGELQDEWMPESRLARAHEWPLSQRERMDRVLCMYDREVQYAASVEKTQAEGWQACRDEISELLGHCRALVAEVQDAREQASIAKIADLTTQALAAQQESHALRLQLALEGGSSEVRRQLDMTPGRSLNRTPQSSHASAASSSGLRRNSLP